MSCNYLQYLQFSDTKYAVPSEEEVESISRNSNAIQLVIDCTPHDQLKGGKHIRAGAQYWSGNRSSGKNAPVLLCREIINRV